MKSLILLVLLLISLIISISSASAAPIDLKEGTNNSSHIGIYNVNTDNVSDIKLKLTNREFNTINPLIQIIYNSNASTASIYVEEDNNKSSYNEIHKVNTENISDIKPKSINEESNTTNPLIQINYYPNNNNSHEGNPTIIVAMIGFVGALIGGIFSFIIQKKGWGEQQKLEEKKWEEQRKLEEKKWEEQRKLEEKKWEEQQKIEEKKWEEQQKLEEKKWKEQRELEREKWKRDKLQEIYSNCIQQLSNYDPDNKEALKWLYILLIYQKSNNKFKDLENNIKNYKADPSVENTRNLIDEVCSFAASDHRLQFPEKQDSQTD